MKIHNLASSSVVIETEYSKILTDPWLLNGEYYGSWHHPSEIQYDSQFLNNITHIYLSHIHPDHFSRKTFEKLNKKIPVLIHNYETKFLKFNIERFGFNVIELDHNKEYFLDSETKIKIYAADNCNPELCGKFFGCSPIESKYKSTQIDSMSLIYNDSYSILNTNDCPYALSSHTLNLIKKEHPKIDFLLTGYAGAGPYPQCFDLDEQEKIEAANKKKLQFLNYGINYINHIKPEFYMPFAGTYILGGKLYDLNKYRGVPKIDEALDYFQSKIDFSKGIILNSYEFFDLTSKKTSSTYKSINSKANDNYLNKVVKNYTFDYELDELPAEKDIIELIPSAFDRFLKKKNEINYNSDYKLYINISEQKDLAIDFKSNSKYEIVSSDNYIKSEKYLRISLDAKLLLRILRGPRYAHWNNAEVGSHLKYQRKPNSFERGLHHSLCYLHS